MRQIIQTDITYLIVVLIQQCIHLTEVTQYGRMHVVLQQAVFMAPAVVRYLMQNSGHIVVNLQMFRVRQTIRVKFIQVLQHITKVHVVTHTHTVRPVAVTPVTFGIIRIPIPIAVIRQIRHLQVHVAALLQTEVGKTGRIITYPTHIRFIVVSSTALVQVVQ